MLHADVLVVGPLTEQLPGIDDEGTLDHGYTQPTPLDLAVYDEPGPVLIENRNERRIHVGCNAILLPHHHVGCIRILGRGLWVSRHPQPVRRMPKRIVEAGGIQIQRPCLINLLKAALNVQLLLCYVRRVVLHFHHQPCNP